MKVLATIVFIMTLTAGAAWSQTTRFNYQGVLKVNGQPANGNFDFNFFLHPASTGDNWLASSGVNNVSVVNGIYSVMIDFGSANFSGGSRFLEIWVKPSGIGDYTTLSPRTEFLSTPYAIHSLESSNATTANNSIRLGGLEETAFARSTDPRLTDARVPLPNSPNYIQNSGSLQPNSTFNISGNGTVGGTLSGNVVSSGSYFSLGNDRILSTSLNDNVFLGVGAGSACAASCRGNSYFGNYAGNSTTIGAENSFFGTFSGRLNTSGANSFFGFSAGGANTTGGDNAFFGGNAGLANTTANQNSFFGRSAGGANTTGSNNSFFGRSAGLSNTTGANNTIIGTLADTLTTDLSYATAIGAGAQVATSNTVVLGRSNGSDSVFIPGKMGIGSQSPVFQLDVGGRIRLKQDSGSSGTSNTAGIWLFQNTPNNDRAFFGMQDDSKVGLYGNTGGGWGFAMNTGTGTTIINALGAAGSTSLCRNASNEISTCSSSERYKNNINTFTPGLDLVKKLRPVSFNWRDGGMLDMGLVAEEVNRAEPLLTTTNAKGEVEGVKYDRVGVVLVNAVKEQQAQIVILEAQRESQQKEIDRQRVEIAKLKKRTAEIDELRAFICGERPRATICKRRNK